MLAGTDEVVLDNTLIGMRIRDARKSAKITQEELATECGCTPTHISNIENGKIGISLDLSFRLGVILNKSMDYFVMDNFSVKPQVYIENEIAQKLQRCAPYELRIIAGIIDDVLNYGDFKQNKRQFNFR